MAFVFYFPFLLIKQIGRCGAEAAAVAMHCKQSRGMDAARVYTAGYF